MADYVVTVDAEVHGLEKIQQEILSLTDKAQKIILQCDTKDIDNVLKSFQKLSPELQAKVVIDTKDFQMDLSKAIKTFQSKGTVFDGNGLIIGNLIDTKDVESQLKYAKDKIESILYGIFNTSIPSDTPLKEAFKVLRENISNMQDELNDALSNVGNGYNGDGDVSWHWLDDALDRGKKLEELFKRLNVEIETDQWGDKDYSSSFDKAQEKIDLVKNSLLNLKDTLNEVHADEGLDFSHIDDSLKLIQATQERLRQLKFDSNYWMEESSKSDMFADYLDEELSEANKELEKLKSEYKELQSLLNSETGNKEQLLGDLDQKNAQIEKMRSHIQKLVSIIDENKNNKDALGFSPEQISSVVSSLDTIANKITDIHQAFTSIEKDGSATISKPFENIRENLVTTKNLLDQIRTSMKDVNINFGIISPDGQSKEAASVVERQFELANTYKRVGEKLANNNSLASEYFLSGGRLFQDLSTKSASEQVAFYEAAFSDIIKRTKEQYKDAPWVKIEKISDLFDGSEGKQYSREITNAKTRLTNAVNKENKSRSAEVLNSIKEKSQQTEESLDKLSYADLNQVVSQLNIISEKIENIFKIINSSLQNNDSIDVLNNGFSSLLDTINQINDSIKSLADTLKSVTSQDLKDLRDVANASNNKKKKPEDKKQSTSAEQDKSEKSIDSQVAEFKKNVDVLKQAQQQLSIAEKNGSDTSAVKQTISTLTTEINTQKTVLAELAANGDMAADTIVKFNAAVQKLDSEKVLSNIAKKRDDTLSNYENKLKQFTDKDYNFDNGEFVSNLNTIKAKIEELRNLEIIDPEKAKQDFNQIKSEIDDLYKDLNKNAKNAKFVSPNEAQEEITKLRQWQANNSRNKRGVSDVESLISSIGNLRITREELNQIDLKFNQIAASSTKAQKNGLSFGDRLKNKFKDVAVYFASYVTIQDAIQVAKEAFNTVRELDTAMVDLQKTTKMSGPELTQFYFDANEQAKNLGVTTKEIIDQASAWSRLGFSSKQEVETMAAVSSQFASISPDLNVDDATTGLVSTMKAFKVEASDAKEEIVSKVNAIGNAFATSNGEIISGLQRSSSAMAAANNSFDETVALFTAGQEVLQNAETVGSSLKTISMRIRGFDEETEELSDDLVNLSGDIADLTKSANTPGGITLFTDETKETYKSTYEILKEISQIWDDLTDKNQAELLEKLFGKTRAQAGAAILSNFSQAEEAIKVMSESAGSADREMEIIEQSLDFKINRLKETWVGFIQDLIDRGTMGEIIDTLTRLSEIIISVTETLGPFGTAIAGAFTFKGFKNIGGLLQNLFKIKDLVKDFKQLKDKGYNPLGYIIQDNKLYASIAKIKDVLGLTTTGFIGLAGGIGIAATAIGGFIYAYNKIYESFDESKNKLNNSISSYTETKKELDSINSELDTTRQKIDSLKSQDSLSFVDQEELRRLETYNNQLEAQKNILETIYEMDKKDAAQQAKNLLMQTHFVSNETNIPEVPEIIYDANGQQLLVQQPEIKKIGIIDKLKESQEELNNVTNDYNELLSKTYSEDEEGIKQYQEDQILISKYGEQIKGLEKDIFEYSKTLQTAYSALFNDDGSIIEGSEYYVEQIESAFDFIKPPEQKAKEADEAADKVVKSYEDSYNKLVELAKKKKEIGGITLDDIQGEEYSDLLSTFTSEINKVTGDNFTVDDLVVKINAEAQVLNKDELKNQLDDTLTSVFELPNIDLDTQDLVDEYLDGIDTLLNLNIDPSKTVFGNIDLDKRWKIGWSDSVIDQYRDVLEEYAKLDFSDYLKTLDPDTVIDQAGYEKYINDYVNSFRDTISTVFGSSNAFEIAGQEVEIAFSPILQTENGAELLSPSTVNQYINRVLKNAYSGDDDIWSMDEILALDAEGFVIDGKLIQGLIADVGETAIATGEAMHYLGKDGALSQIEDDVKSLANVNDFDALLRNAKKAKKFEEVFKDLTSDQQKSLVNWMNLDENKSWADWEIDDIEVNINNVVNGFDDVEQEVATVAQLQEHITKVAENMDKVQTAISSSASATGLTTAQVSELKEIYESVEGFDPSKLFERTENGIHLNAQALKKYNEQLEYQTRKGIYDQIIKKQEELANASGSDISKLQDELRQLQLIAAEYDGLTSKYNKYIQATSTANDRDSLEQVANGYKQIGDLIAEGWVTDDSVLTYLDLLLGKDRLDSVNNSIEAYALLDDKISGLGHSLKDYMTFDDSGKFTSQGVWNFAEDVEKLLGEEYSTEIDGVRHLDFTGNKLQTVADAFGTTTEFIELMVRALSDANMIVDMDTQATRNFNNALISTNEEATNAHDALLDLQNSTEGQYLQKIQLDYDIDKMSSSEIESKISELTKRKTAIIKTGADTEEAVKTIQLLEQEINNLNKKNILAKINVAMENGTTLEDIIAMADDPDALMYTLNIDTEQVDDAKELLQTISDTSIEAPLVVSIADEQFSALTQPKESTETITITANNEDALTKVQEVKDAVENANPEMTIRGNAEPAKRTASSAANTISGMTSAKLPIHAETSKLQNEIQSSLNQMNLKATVHATVNTGTVKKTVQRISYDATGTMIAQASGTAYNVYNYKRLGAYAKGSNVSLDENEDALVNELGTESVVRNGQWFTIPGGPHVESLKKGDIVFSAAQTKDLLERGRTFGHARAYASGTVSGMSAYGLNADGTNPWKANGVTVINGDINYNNTSYNNNNNNHKNNNSDDDIKDDVSKLTDWIEVKMNRLQKKIDNYIASAELMVDLQDKLGKDGYGGAQDNLKKAINSAIKGAEKYFAQADKQAKEDKLDPKIIEKIKDGSIVISDYYESTRTAIENYQQWYEKGIELQSQVLELQQQQKDVEQSRLDAINEYYESQQNYNDSVQKTSQSMLDYYTAQGKAVNSKDAKKQIRKQIDQQRKSNFSIEEQMKAYAKEMKNAKSIFGKDSPQYLAAMTAYEEQKTKLNEGKTAIIDFNKQIRQLDITKIQYAIDGLSDFTSRLSATLSYKIAKNGESSITEKDYTNQITGNNDLINQWQKKINDLRQEQFENNYEIGSEEYERIRSEVEGAEQEIIKLGTANENLKDSATELRWKEFEDLHNKINKSVEDFDYLRSTMSDESFFDEKGGITENGLTNILLLGGSIFEKQQDIANYRTGLEKLQKQLASGLINQDEYNKKSEEYIGIIKSSASAVNGYKNSLVDMYKTQIKAENDALQETIDLRKDALKKKKDYYDYDKKLKNQNKDVQSLKAQIAALEGVENQASKAELARLKENLADKQETLDNTIKDHEYEVKISGYDKLKDDANKALEDTLKELEISSEKQQEVVDMMLGKMETSYKNSFENINNIVSSTGIVLSEMTTELMTTLDEAGLKAVDLMEKAGKSLPESNKEANDVKTGNIKTNKDSKGNKTDKALSNATNGKTFEQQQSDYNKNDAKITSIELPDYRAINKGSATTLHPTIKPSNVQVKLTWSSANTGVATVDKNGKISAIKVGTAKITVKDTRSGKSASCLISVGDFKAETTSNKESNKNTPSVVTPKQDNNTQNSKTQDNKGNKTLSKSDVKVGDKVKFDSGKYFAASDATGSTGNLNLGKDVYIQKINTASWATKPYLIGTSKNGGGLGWVSLDQLKGYKRGKQKIVNGQWAFTQEDGQELVISPNRDGMLTRLDSGDAVITADMTKNLVEWGKMNPGILNQYTRKPGINSPGKYDNFVSKSNTVNNIHYDALININGNVDKNVIDDLENIAKSLLNSKSFMDGTAKYTSKELTKELKKFGYK